MKDVLVTLQLDPGTYQAPPVNRPRVPRHHSLAPRSSNEVTSLAAVVSQPAARQHQVDVLDPQEPAAPASFFVFLLIARVVSLGRSTATELRHRPFTACSTGVSHSCEKERASENRHPPDGVARGAVQNVKTLPAPTPFGEVHGENGLVYDSAFAPHAFECSGRLRAGDLRSQTGHGC